MVVATAETAPQPCFDRTSYTAGRMATVRRPVAASYAARALCASAVAVMTRTAAAALASSRRLTSSLAWKTMTRWSAMRSVPGARGEIEESHQIPISDVPVSSLDVRRRAATEGYSPKLRAMTAAWISDVPE